MKNQVIKSFDKIAKFEDKWDHNRFYEHLIIKEIDKDDANALDIGCGTGEFSQRLAARVKTVCGIDISPQMISEAIKRHKENNIQYIVQDFEECSDNTRYDYIISIAAFHHLNMESGLLKIKKLLKEDGKLIVLDLYKRSGIIDLLLDIIAVPINLLLKTINNVRMSDEEALVWKEHGYLDRYETYKNLKRIYEQYLGKNIKIKRLLLWRYILIFRNNTFLNSD